MPFLTGSTTTATSGPGVPGTIVQQRMASLGGVTFGVVDNLGTFVYLEDIKGWTGSPATTGEVAQRTAGHGGFPSSAFLTPKVLEVSLTLVGGSFDLVEQSMANILAAVPLSVPGAFAVTNPGGSTLTADVRQAGEILVDQKGAFAKVSIPLVAPDPRRYGPSVTASTGLPQTSGGLSLPFSLPASINATVTSGVLSVSNDGNMETSPVLEVRGPSPAFWLTHRGSGRTLRSAESVPAGRTLVIDTDRRTALLDGTEPRVLTGSWFDYAPGVNEVAFGAATYDSGALLTSSHRSAWR